MATILRNTPIDHIMYSVDYPFGNNVRGKQFIQDLKTSGLVTEEEWEKIAFKNAESLLNLK
jgi:predicted TIM-barrel fold metal-dependent hydrolase